MLPVSIFQPNTTKNNTICSAKPKFHRQKQSKNKNLGMNPYAKATACTKPFPFLYKPQYFEGNKKRKTIMNSISIWFCSNNSKNLFVKIVHPGGHVELHDRPILASELLNRNPKYCVAHPTVFQQPYDIISPDTMLNLGRKYYVVPINTVKKLQLHCSPFILEGNQPVSNQDIDIDETSSFCWSFRNSKNGAETKNGGSVGAGMKFKSSISDISKEEMMNYYGKKRSYRSREDSDLSTSGLSPGRLSLASYDDWQPDLESVTGK